MSAITNLWRQLVQRRLWPVAILLIAALAAVPLTLAEEPEPVEPVADATAAVPEGDAALAVEPIVAQATAGDRTKRRKVLGASKNPFGIQDNEAPGSAAAPSSNGSTIAQDPVAPESPADGATPSLPSLGGSPPVGGAPVPTAPVDPSTPAPKRYAPQELTVRFGGDEAMRRMSVKRLEALPLGEEEPLVVYLGVADGGKAAVFLLDSSIRAEGDGECVPDPATCEKIHLREGETEFFDVLDESGESVAAYQLDLVEIHGKKKPQAGRTAAARAAAPGALQDRAETAGVARTADAGLALLP